MSIKVENLKKRSGKIMAAVCNDPKDFFGKAVEQQAVTVPASGDMIIVFKNLPAGKYAVRFFHDENNSGKLETSMLGIPKEPYGFSNNPSPLMRAPTFEEAVFTISANTTIKIKLK